MVQKGSDKMPEVDAIRAQLFALQDKEYQVFHSRLMPTLPPETVIGVRVPLLRKLAKQLTDTPEAEVFLQELPHFYYEENALHAFLLESVRDFGTALAATERFLPYVDNWAVCDSFSPKVFAQHKPELLTAIRRWLGSDQVYTVRYGIGMLMRYYLDDAFSPEYLAWAAAVHSEEYYVNMMRAWYFATALAKQPAAALPWLTEKRLDVWTHNKTIQKAVESYRIPPEQKQALRALRIRSQKLCEERHDEQHAGEYRQRHIGGGELGQARRVADLPFPRGHRIGPAGTEVERAGDGMIGRSPPDETVYAAEHGEEDGGGCGEGDDCQHRGVAGAAAQAGAVKQPPEGERAHRAPPAVVSLPPAGAAERSEAEGGSAPSGHPQSACG